METKTEILVVGTHEEILQTILRLLNNHSLWNATGVSAVDEVITQCRQTDYDVLLIGAGLTEGEEELLRTEIRRTHPDLPVVLHYGGGSGLLYAEIYLALAQKKADL